MQYIFPFTLFLSALLLFSIQPMVAKALLPVYGGTPAVWTVCMLFFQLVLLCAYGYVWLLSLINKPLIWRILHTGLIIISVLLMPLMFYPEIREGLPEWAICYNLLMQVGLPLLLIGTTAPLLQYAYSQSKIKNAADPYFLYVASNLGSLLALLAYPWLIERFIGLNLQFYLWSLGFALYIALLFVILYGGNHTSVKMQIEHRRFWPWKEMAYWLLLSFIPCSLMLGVTLYITTDLAATPLFWVLPLALYLLSFVLTFSSRSVISHNWLKKYAIYFLLATVALFYFGPTQIKIWLAILINLSSFFVMALLCHRELYLRRPNPQLLTLFYFCMALGGVIAGLFNGMLAPHMFNEVYEYPLVILLSILLLTNIKWWFRGCCAVSVLVLFALPMLKQDVLLKNRSFYAINRVENKQGVHVFFSQSTVHGLQDMQEQKPPSGFRSYYGAIQPVVDALKQEFTAMNVSIMGLGTGTMLCQFRAEDTVHVMEIDQQVIDIAQNPMLFTYLNDCLPKTKIIKNDGRIALATLPDSSQNLLVLDAFNSDAIPVHLMTLEAFSLYKNKLAKNGVILVNLSNRHLRLLPVVNAIAQSLDLLTLHIIHLGDKQAGQFNSEWALLTANEELAFKIMRNTNWQFAAEEKQFLWTDDYSNIIPLLRV